MAAETNCSNCNQNCAPDDMFCENCGYDFLTGSLPPDLDGIGVSASSPAGKGSASAGLTSDGEAAESEAKPDGSENGGEEASIAESEVAERGESDPDVAEESGAGTKTSDVGVERVKVEIAVDRAFFDQVVTGGEIDFPSDPVPAQTIEIAGDEIHIGRTSESRAIHPDIDIAELTEDQAVSSRHAVIRVVEDGKLQLIDVGSTNGTFLESPSSEAIEQGETRELAPGIPFYVGAWTKLTIVKDD